MGITTVLLAFLSVLIPIAFMIYAQKKGRDGQSGN